MSRPKILHIRSSYFYGGPERQTTYLIQCLAQKGIESGVVTFALKKAPDLNKYYRALQNLDYPSHLISISGSYDRSAIKAMAELIDSEGYNLLVGHDYRAHYFVLKLSRRPGLTGLGYSRGWTSENIKVKIYEWLDIRFLKKIDGVIAVSEGKYRELAAKGISEDKLVYIPNSIIIGKPRPRINVIRNKFGIPHDAFLIGTAGRLSAEKSHETLIRAAAEILENNSENLYFIIAGEGTREKYLKSLIPESLRKRIILAGWIEDNDAFYADIDLFALTSLTEGFPNVLLEAGKYNLPVISTPAGGAVEIIRDGETGFFIPFGGQDRLREKITLLHNDTDLRSKLGESLGKRTREKFSADINADRFMEFAQRIMSKRSRR